LFDTILIRKEKIKEEGQTKKKADKDSCSSKCKGTIWHIMEQISGACRYLPPPLTPHCGMQ